MQSNQSDKQNIKSYIFINYQIFEIVQNYDKNQNTSTSQIKKNLHCEVIKQIHQKLQEEILYSNKKNNFMVIYRKHIAQNIFQNTISDLNTFCLKNDLKIKIYAIVDIAKDYNNFAKKQVPLIRYKKDICCISLNKYIQSIKSSIKIMIKYFNLGSNDYIRVFDVRNEFSEGFYDMKRMKIYYIQDKNIKLIEKDIQIQNKQNSQILEDTIKTNQNNNDQKSVEPQISSQVYTLIVKYFNKCNQQTHQHTEVSFINSQKRINIQKIKFVTAQNDFLILVHQNLLKFINKVTSKNYFHKTQFIFQNQMSFANIDIPKIKQQLIRQKITYNIYAHYDVFIPQTQIFQQHKHIPTNLTKIYGLQSQDFNLPSLLIQQIQNFHHYKTDKKLPSQLSILKTKYVNIEDQYFPETGIGKILMVAHFIRDLDVFNYNCRNIGFIIKDGSCKSIKINPDDAFYKIQDIVNQINKMKESKTQKFLNHRQKQKIRQLKLAYNAPTIKFDDLNNQIKVEFLQTLKKIIQQANQQNFAKFFYNQQNIQVYPLEQIQKICKSAVIWLSYIQQSFNQFLIQLQLRKQYSKNQKMQLFLKNSKYFVFPKVKIIQQDKDDQYIQSLFQSIQIFLKSKQKLLLLKGEGGCGKTMALKYYYIVQSDKNKDGKENEIIFIDLKFYNIQKLRQRLSKQVNQNTKILILDSYDQLQHNDKKNIYKYCKLQKYKSKLKVIISCNNLYFQSNYFSWFGPTTTRSSIKILQIQPYSQIQIRDFLYLHSCKPKISQQYIKTVSQNYLIANLLNLQNLLTLNIIPLKKKKLTKYIIYSKLNQFYQNKFQFSQQQKLIHRQFLGQIAYKMLIQQKFVTQIQSNSIKLPLNQIYTYENSIFFFNHKFFLEYYATNYIIAKILAEQYNQQIKNISNNGSLCSFIKEYLQTNLTIKTQLYEKIQKSKSNKNLAFISAAAITILNICRQNFRQKDFSNINITGADLSCGYFQKTNFSNSNLIDVNFNKSFLLKTNFTNANLNGISIGAMPSISFQDEVNCIDIDAQQLKLIACGKHGKIKIYDIQSIQILYEANQHIEIKKIKFSPIDNNIYAYTYKNKIKIRNLNLNQFQGFIQIQGHEDIVESFAFSSNGQQIISCSHDKTIKLWNIQSKENIKTFIGHQNSVLAVIFSPDDQKIASAGSDNKVMIWNVQQEQALHTLEQHWNWVLDLSFSPTDEQNNTLVTCGGDRTAIIWNIQEQEAQINLQGHEGVINCIKYTQDNKKIISGSNDNKIRIWDGTAGLLIQTLEGHQLKVTSVCYINSRKLIVSGSYDQTIRFWSEETKTHIQNEKQHTNSIYVVCFSPCGLKIASGSYDCTIKIWDTQKQNLISTLQGHSQAVYALKYPSTEKLVSGSFDMTIIIWNLQTGSIINKLQTKHITGIYDLLVINDCETIVSCSGDCTIKIWHQKDNYENPINLQKHNSDVISLDYSQNTKMMVSSSKDLSIITWDFSFLVQKPTFLNRLQKHKKSVVCVKFIQYGNKIISGSVDMTLKIWEAKSGILLKSIENIDNNNIKYPVINFDYLPIQNILIVSSNKKKLTLWDLNEQNLISVLQGSESNIYGVNFSKDGKKIATGSYKNSLKVWNADKDNNYYLQFSIPQNRIYARNIRIVEMKASQYIKKLMDHQFS